MNTQIQSPVQREFLQEFLDLIAAGATEGEAIVQIAQSNGVRFTDVVAQLHSEDARLS